MPEFPHRPPAPMLGALIADMHYALLSEVGASTIYSCLARSASREDLRVLLSRLAAESEQVREGLRELMQELGGSPPWTSRRRRLLARALAKLKPVIGIRRILRLCQHAAETISRSHARYAVYLEEHGELERARRCQSYAMTKMVHAQALSAWLGNLQNLA